MHGGALIVHREFRNGMKQLGLRSQKSPWPSRIARCDHHLLVGFAHLDFLPRHSFPPPSNSKSFVFFRSPGRADFGSNCLIAFGVLVAIHWIAIAGGCMVVGQIPACNSRRSAEFAGHGCVTPLGSSLSSISSDGSAC